MEDVKEFKRRRLEAVTRENHIRNAAFLELVTPINGKPVAPVTLRHWIVLDGIDSPFLRGNTIPSPADVVKALWVLNPNFTQKGGFRRWWFIRSCRKLPYGDTAAKVFQYINDSFQDMPGYKEGGSKMPYISFAANPVWKLAKEFGWTDEYILGRPLKVVFQYLKAIHIAEGGTPFNPSDKIEAERLAAVNEERRAR